MGDPTKTMKTKRIIPILPFVIVLVTSPALTKGQQRDSSTPRTSQTPEQSELQGQTSPLKHLAIQRHTLKNGLRVVLSPDRTIPTVAVAIYYNVGSRNEKPERSGFAHLFEHMMFQGSKNVGKMEHFQLITQRGGDANGSTSEDRTNYFQTLPSNELALGLWLEADRMRSLAVTMENFENQRQTVMEERRQSYDNQPYMKSMLRINELAYGDYWPYAHSTIGDMKDLQKAPLKAVKEFFNTYYVPNNAVLSIAGDFEPDQALNLIERYFGDISSGKVPEYKPEPPSIQDGERYEKMVDPLAQLPAFHIAYHIPPDRDPDHYPLEMLGIVIGDGESSRLYQMLIKQRELLSKIYVGTDGHRGPDLFSFWAICAQGKSCTMARNIIYKVLAQIAKAGIRPRELEKAQNRVRSAFVFGLESNLQRAKRLAEYEMYWDDADLLRDEVDRYLNITNNDIKRVTKKYFTPSNRTVLDVITTEMDKKQKGQAKKQELMDRSMKKRATPRQKSGRTK